MIVDSGSTRAFPHAVVWPKVLEFTASGSELPFPAFHPEILRQANWDASEQRGRVRIVIAEGVLRSIDAHGPPEQAFDRLRDVVAFSFQHAPQRKLSGSEIGG
jgi:hypothetical protein